MVTVSSAGPTGLFKGMTTATSGVIDRFPLLFPVRNSVASYGASAVTRTPDRGHVAEVKNQFHGVAGSQSGFPKKPFCERFFVLDHSFILCQIGCCPRTTVCQNKPNKEPEKVFVQVHSIGTGESLCTGGRVPSYRMGRPNSTSRHESAKPFPTAFRDSSEPKALCALVRPMPVTVKGTLGC